MKSLIQEIKSKKILVIGDLMLDVYLRGRADRISPEAPVPVVTAESKDFVPGGAANVMANLKALGCHVTGAGFVGKDEEGDFLLESLKSRKVNTECILRCSLPTIHKTRVIANGHHVVRYDFDSDFNLLNDECKKLAGYMESLAVSRSYDAVIISDYCKGTICEELMSTVKDRFKCPVICDTKPAHKKFFHNVGCITPNLLEARQMMGCDDKVDPETIARTLKEEMSLDSIIITMADEGILCVDEADVCYSYPAYTEVEEHDPHQRFDSTGAGDTVISAFAACISAGIETKQSMFISNVAAGVIVRKIGTATCSFGDLSSELDKIEDEGIAA